jgi:hypothetical protein
MLPSNESQHRRHKAFFQNDRKHRPEQSAEGDRGSRPAPGRNGRYSALSPSRLTDVELQKWVVRHHGFVPQSDWIAHCKALLGAAATPTGDSTCPPDKQAAISQGLRALGLTAAI